MDLMNAGQVVESEYSIELSADKKTDFFIDYRTQVNCGSAPFLYTEMTGDFVISACVAPQFKEKYDGGGLFVYDNEKKWIKHEFEFTDIGYPSVVCVITNDCSDDSNGERMDGKELVYLQIVRKGNYWALHHSADNKNWKMARYFCLNMSETVKVGFEAQSPVGTGTTVRFTDMYIGKKEIEDMRKGV